jgi:protein TonB
VRIDKRYAAGWAIGLVLHAGIAFAGYRVTPAPATADDFVPVEIVSELPVEVEEAVEEPKPEPEPEPVPPQPQPEPEPVDMTDRPIPTQADPEAEPEAEPVFGLSDESVGDDTDASELDLEGLLDVPIGNTVDIAPGGERPDTVRALAPVPFHLTTTPPQMISPPVPVYPRILREAAMTGRVNMELVIDVEGRVIEATVVNSTHDLFSKAALEAVKTCRFSPGKQNGVTVPVRVYIPLRFTLE